VKSLSAFKIWISPIKTQIEQVKRKKNQMGLKEDKTFVLKPCGLSKEKSPN
jgi:hypothetical protein